MVYRVTEAGGEVLIDDLSGSELEALNPELYARILATWVPAPGMLMGLEH